MMAVDFKNRLGQTFKIQSFRDSAEHVNSSKRLLDIGFYSGMTFKVINQTAFNGPWIVESDSIYVALREEELACLVIE